MRRILVTLAVLSSIQFASGKEGHAPAAFDLVRQGTPTCSIVIAEEPTPAARLAALELQCHVMQITGAEIPIRCESEQVGGRRILVWKSACKRDPPLE